jgi:hypothetical protein
MKVVNYPTPKNKFKRYFHAHCDSQEGCKNPKASNYCYDSKSVLGKKYCYTACLVNDSSNGITNADIKKEEEKAFIMN